ncbi:DUF1552 domain-containing protein [Nannocystaceae bacterium ST9]
MKRRELLRLLGLGGLAGATTAAGLLAARDARGGESDPPRRLLVVFHKHGTVYQNWKIRRDGLDELHDGEFGLGDLAAEQFSLALRPLHRHRSNLLVLDGLALLTPYTDTISNIFHEKGQVAALTGERVDAGAGLPLARNASVDQRIADRIARPDRLRSIELVVGDGNYAPINHRAAGQALALEGELLAVWNRMFGPSQGLVGVDAGPHADWVASRQARLLEQAAADHRRTARQLSGQQRERLELHRSLLASLERQVEGLRGIACAGVELPSGELGWLERFDLAKQLVVAGFACDLTRVATLAFGDDVPLALIGGTGSHVHNDYAHAMLDGAHPAEVMTNYYALFSDRVAALLDALAEIPEGGGSLLDSTTVVWVGELGNGVHGYEPWPVVVAGGERSPFRLGRYLRWAPRTPAPRPDWPHDGLHEPGWPNAWAGVPHHHLLVSLARAFGLDLDSIGQSEIVLSGERVDLRGPLDRLI